MRSGDWKVHDLKLEYCDANKDTAVVGFSTSTADIKRGFPMITAAGDGNARIGQLRRLLSRSISGSKKEITVCHCTRVEGGIPVK